MTDNGRTFRIGLLTLIIAFVVVGGIVALSGSAAALEINKDSDGYNNSLVVGAGAQQIGDLSENKLVRGTSKTAEISMPKGITLNSQASTISTSARNVSSFSAEIQDSGETLFLSYDVASDAGSPRFVNVTGLRVDVDDSVGSSPSINTELVDGESETIPFDVNRPTVATNKTTNMTRGQNGIGPRNVTLTAPSTEVSGEYNKSVVAQDSDITIGFAGDDSRAEFDTGSTVKVYSNQTSNAVQNGTEATVASDSISFTATEGNLSSSEQLNLTGVQFSTTGTSDDTVVPNFTVNVSATTSGEDFSGTATINATDTTASGFVPDGSINAEAPGAALNTNVEVTSGLSNTTRFNISVQDNTTSGGALGAGEDIVVSIPSDVSGVTFNNSDNAPPTKAFAAGADDNNIKNSSVSETFLDVSQDVITLTPNNATTSAFDDSGTTLNITNVTLNIAPGTTNQTFNLTTETTAANGSDSIIQNTSAGTSQHSTVNTIQVANGNNVTGDDGTGGSEFGPYGNLADGETINATGKIQPGDTFTAAVNVTDKFGGNPNGIDVKLNVTDNPSSQDIISTENIVTNETGEAGFEVSIGDRSGFYNITASLDHNASANVTFAYEASPGDPAGVEVTGEHNALKDDSQLGESTANLAQGAYQVQLIDENGNPANISDGSTQEFTLETSANIINVTNNQTGSEGTVDPTSDVAISDTVSSGGTITFDPTDITDGGPARFIVTVSDDSPGTPELTATAASSTDSGSITIYDDPDTVSVTADKQSPADGETVNITGTAQTASGENIQIAGIDAEFETTDSGVAFFGSGEGTNTTSSSGTVAGEATVRNQGDVQFNVTLSDNGFSDVTGTLQLGAQPEPEPEPAPGQVELTNVNLDPSTVTNGSTNDHTLTFDAVNVSDDGNTDTFTITFPSAATLNSLDSASVTDAGGNEVTITDSDVSGNTITVDVAPDSSADTRDLTVSADVNVTVADVTSDATADINIDVNNGQDSATATLTVDAVAPGDVPADIPDSVNAEQYTAFAGDDGEITQPDAINGFNGWFENGSYNGVDFEQREALDLFNYWFNSG